MKNLHLLETLFGWCLTILLVAHKLWAISADRQPFVSLHISSLFTFSAILLYIWLFWANKVPLLCSLNWSRLDGFWITSKGMNTRTWTLQVSKWFQLVGETVAKLENSGHEKMSNYMYMYGWNVWLNTECKYCTNDCIERIKFVVGSCLVVRVFLWAFRLSSLLKNEQFS